MRNRGREPSTRTAPNGHQLEGDRLEREGLNEIQRARVLSAMAEVCAERGAANVTVAHVVARSGVSRRTFYELFEDREDCFLAAFDRAVEQIAVRVVPAYEQADEWNERIRDALTALLQFLEEEPGIGRLVVVEVLGAGTTALEHRSRMLARVVAAVDEGREAIGAADGPSPITAEGITGAVFAVLHTRMLEEPRSSLSALVNSLMGMIVLPYLGPKVAAKEIRRRVPKSNGKAEGANCNPLKDLEMRLTYRTVRVLMAIGSHPGVSNRRVADESGIVDQGQISKLLARLDHLGLIENSGFGQAKGESNSWYLTERGAEIERAIREQTERQ